MKDMKENLPIAFYGTYNNNILKKVVPIRFVGF